MPERAGSFLRFTLAFAGVLALAGPVHAQSPDDVKAARQTATDALNAYNAGEYDKALGLFQKAKQLYPSAQILRMVGYSELALEHWVKALEALEGALDSKVSPLSKEDKKEVQDNIAKAMTHVGTLSVTTKVAGAQLVLDGGDPRPLPIDKPIRLVEGAHKVVVTAPDRLDAAGDVKIEPGKQADLALDPAVKPPPPPAPKPPPLPPPKPERTEIVPHQRTVALAAAGAGVAFGVAALITAVEWGHWKSVAASDAATHEKFYGKGCAMGDPRLCAYDVTVTNHEADTADRLRNAAAGLGVTTVVLVATGAVFYVLAPKPKPAPADGAAPPPQASLRCGVTGGAGLLCSGSF
jgi:hypothetical protein